MINVSMSKNTRYAGTAASPSAPSAPSALSKKAASASLPVWLLAALPIPYTDKSKHRQLELAHKWQSVDSDVYNNQRNVRTLRTQKRQQSPVYPGERKKSNRPCG